jgi:hypothetical protein
MNIIFCADPLNPCQVDEAYQAEADVAKAVGFDYAIINFEALVNENNVAKAMRQVPTEEANRVGIYRGWMLKPRQYDQLYKALADKGIVLINNPTAYTHCHYLPESYAVIETATPKSVWLRMDEFSLDKVMELLQPFAAKPVIVKDFVKSQKHYWLEACFISSAANRAAVEQVVQRFIELQGEDLNEGLVFREFVEFEPLATHSKSGMPLTKEFRLFVFDGEPFYAVEYWEEGEYGELRPPTEAFLELARNVKSRFFTMDIAKRKDGEWMIIELGDGQVAGLPESVEAREFYQALFARAK